jgi:hypothetical protein
LGLGAKVSIGFTGTQIKYFTPTYSTIGRVRVTIDGTIYGFSQGGTTENSAIRFTSPPLPYGQYIATFELDPDNPDNGSFFYDALEIVGNATQTIQYAPAGYYEENSPYFQYQGGASSPEGGSNYSGGYGCCFGLGTKIIFGFTGTQIKFYTPAYVTIGRIKVTVDGTAYYFEQGGTTGNSALRFTSIVFPCGNHIATVELDPDNPGNGSFYWDATEII